MESINNMELIFIHILIELILIASAYFDYKTKRVPDILTCGLWLVWILSQDFVSNFGLISVVFVFLYLANTIRVMLKGQPFLGWADILGIPSWLISIHLLGKDVLLTFVVFSSVFLFGNIIRKNDTMPLYPFLAFVHLAFLLCSLVKVYLMFIIFTT